MKMVRFRGSSRKHLARRQLLLFALALAGCGPEIDGPTPSISSVVSEVQPAHQPAVVCNAQGDSARGWLVDVLGTGFSPLPIRTLAGTAGLAMPAVTLSGPEQYALPDTRVLFSSPTLLPLALPTGDTTEQHQLAPGAYEITVQNPNGHSARLASAFTVVPPPLLNAVDVTPAGTSPGGPFLCNDQAQTLVLSGKAFRQELGVSFVGALQVPAALTTVDVTGTITVSMPAGSFTPAQTGPRSTNHTVRVTNVDGCVAPYGSDPQGLGITDVKVLATCLSLGQIAVVPTADAQGRNRAVQLRLTGNGSQVQFTFPGSGQEAIIIAPLKSRPSQPVAIPLSQVFAFSRTLLFAVVPVCSGTAPVAFGDPGPPGCPNGIVPGGPYPIYVSDPNGGVGSVPAAQGYQVSP